MKLREAEQLIRQSLQQLYDEGEASAITRLALEHATGWGVHELPARRNEDLDGNTQTRLQDILSQLRAHRPIQYILEKAWFYGMELFVDARVLIPRPETEELVHWVVADVQASGLDVFERGPAQADRTRLLKLLDVGTGSGCIALALKKSMPKAEVWGCDISEPALNVARRNGSHLDIRVDFQGADFLDPAQQKMLPSVDIVVSNPPYIPQSGKKDMAPHVTDHEPHAALFVPDEDPLVFYRALLHFSGHRLHEGGRLYMEIHEDLGPQVCALFEKEGFGVELKKDMQGKPRMVKAVRQVS